MRFCEGQSYVTERQIDMSPFGCIPAGTVLQVTDVQQWNGMVVFEYANGAPKEIDGKHWDSKRIELCGDDLDKVQPYLPPFTRARALASRGLHYAGWLLLIATAISELGGDLSKALYAHTGMSRFVGYSTVRVQTDEAIQAIAKHDDDCAVSWTTTYFPQCVRRN